MLSFCSRFEEGEIKEKPPVTTTQTIFDSSLTPSKRGFRLLSQSFIIIDPSSTMFKLLSTLALVLATTTHAWVGTSTSAFGGSVLTNTGGIQNAHSMEMKKSKPNLPPQMRGQYKQQKEMALMRKEMDAATKVGNDGLPVFNLYVRTKTANMWYPCGSFKGDDRSAALSKGYADNGIFAGISKKQLDSGISGSLYRDLDRLNETCCRAYPQLRKSRGGFEFGYKLAFDGLSEEQSKEICPVEPKEQKGVLDGIKNMFS